MQKVKYRGKNIFTPQNGRRNSGAFSQKLACYLTSPFLRILQTQAERFEVRPKLVGLLMYGRHVRFMSAVHSL